MRMTHMFTLAIIVAMLQPFVERLGEAAWQAGHQLDAARSTGFAFSNRPVAGGSPHPMPRVDATPARLRRSRAPPGQWNITEQITEYKGGIAIRGNNYFPPI
jgi:hypothetical protein